MVGTEEPHRWRAPRFLKSPVQKLTRAFAAESRVEVRGMFIWSIFFRRVGITHRPEAARDPGGWGFREASMKSAIAMLSKFLPGRGDLGYGEIRF